MLFLGDPKRLRQVLFNLLSNALKFTPKHGTIKVTAWSEKDTELVYFQVTDSGIGIAKEHIPRLFQVSTAFFTILFHVHS